MLLSCCWVAAAAGPSSVPEDTGPSCVHVHFCWCLFDMIKQEPRRGIFILCTRSIDKKKEKETKKNF
jgi:hypothetical protein